jgi:general secretion pathway protein G
MRLIRIWVIGIASIALTACSKDTARLDQEKHTTARAAVRDIAKALELYRLRTGAYPSTADGLQALVAHKDLVTLPKDPWGRPYIYKLEGDEPEVLCLGADGKPGGKGAAADISRRDQ